MTATKQLHAIGQSVWLDNISRPLLDSGTLQHYCADFGVTGLTSNPSIFEKAIRETDAYDEYIFRRAKEGVPAQTQFFELAIEDLTQAAQLFQPIHVATKGVDGWVSLEVSPLLASDTDATIREAKRLHALAQCSNLFIKVPGNKAGLPAIEELIFAGIPVNITLLFSREHYVAASDAYWRAIERRLDAGLNPEVGSVASVFVSRWDGAALHHDPKLLRSQLGIAMACRIYKAHCERHASLAWRKLSQAGALPQRLLWASTGSKDPSQPDTYYARALAAPGTINTMPEKTLLAFVDHGEVFKLMDKDGGDAEYVLLDFARAGLDIDATAIALQQQGTASFVTSWLNLLDLIASKSTQSRT